MMRLVVLVAACAAITSPATAQGFNPFGDTQVTTGAYGVTPQWSSARGRSNAQGPGSAQALPPLTGAPAFLDGGPRPSISGSTPPLVDFRSGYSAGSVVIDSGGRSLYYISSSTKAYRYPIAVGREGFTWTGTERISRKADWPEWRPPAEMRQRVAGLPEIMSGGIRNPLGARALYLGSTLYRIHGTNDTRSLGSASSSGCFRMANAHVVDLANRVSIGTTVHVVGRLPASISRGVADADELPAARKPRRG
jgi:lipoprotein-anchoring transpeptidase ErfK/SrfK